MLTDALIAANPVLRLTDAVSDPAKVRGGVALLNLQFATLTDSVVHQIEVSTDEVLPVGGAGSLAAGAGVVAGDN